MVDIMQGSSNHATYAPLSHQQTVSICKHLQDQIDMLMNRFNNLDTSNNAAHEAVQSVKDHVKSLSVEQNLKDMRNEYSNYADNSHKELGRTNAAVGKAQQAIDQAGENLLVLREAQKVTTVNLQNVVQDVAHNQAAIAGVRDIVERKVLVDLEKLRDELSKTNLLVRHLQSESEASKAAIQGNKEDIRKNRLDIQALRVDLGNTDVRAQLCEQRVADLQKGLREARQGLEDTGAQVVNLKENQDVLRANVSDLTAALKKAAAIAKHGQELSEKNAHDLQALNTNTGSVESNVEANRQGLEQAKLAVRGLREGQDRTTAQQNAIIAQLDQLRAVLMETKRSLSATNSLVLPNLSFDAMHSSLSTGGSGRLSPISSSAPTAPSTARPSKGSKKVAGSGDQKHQSGNSVDRMAWI